MIGTHDHHDLTALGERYERPQRAVYCGHDLGFARGVLLLARHVRALGVQMHELVALGQKLERGGHAHRHVGLGIARRAELAMIEPHSCGQAAVERPRAE